MVRYHDNVRESYKPGTPKFCMETLKKVILLNQKARYSGYTYVSFVSHDSNTREISNNFESVKGRSNFSSSTSIISRLTVALSNRNYWFDTLDKPQRLYSVDEVRGYTPFVTNSSWSLDKIYCRNRMASFVAIVKGEVRVNMLLQT